MATTYDPIATTTLGSANNAINFSSIPSTYTDLRVVWTLTGAASGNSVLFRLNSDSAANYSATTLYGTGSAATSSRSTASSVLQGDYWGSAPTGTNVAFYTIDLFSYANTSTYKTVLITASNDLNGSGNTTMAVGLWRSTAAINAISLYLGVSDTQGIGSRATLYGIKAA